MERNKIGNLKQQCFGHLPRTAREDKRLENASSSQGEMKHILQ